MKVLQVTTHVNIGGIANYILSLSEALKSKGVNCVVASSGGNLEGELALRQIEHLRLDIKTKFEFGPRVIGSAFRIAKYVKKEKVNIIHAHTRVSQVASLLASVLTGVPLVTTCHGYFKVRSRRIFDTWGDRVIAISDATRCHLMREMGVKDDRISLIYSGVNVAKFGKDFTDAQKAETKKRLGLKDGPIVGTIGRLSQVKGQRYLIQAMQYVIAANKDAQCLIVGDGEEKLALENLAKALNIRDAVKLTPSYVDTPSLLAIMDVFVFPSVKEGLGIALLEAMASGKACVASDIGGIRNIITDPSYGILAPVGDIKAIASGVMMLLNDKQLANTIGRKARELTAQKFSLDVMSRNIIELYQKVIDEKNIRVK